MTLSEILQDLHALESRLRAYEAQYGIASEDFHELYRQGLLDDNDVKSTLEFTRWASAYTMKLEREQSFHEQSQRFISTLRLNTPTGALHLIPNPELQRV